MQQSTENIIRKEKERPDHSSKDFSALNGIEIREVKTRKQMDQFISFPNQLYKGNSYYVPQLKKDLEATFNKSKNPAYDFCEARHWLAYKNGKLAGRIAAIINHSFINVWQKAYVRFGWIDFIEDENVVKALLLEVEHWAHERGMKAVHGPLGFSNFDYGGMLTSGFGETGTFVTIYNYPYYPVLLEKAGYQKETGWVEYRIKVPDSVPEKLVKAASIVERRLQLKTLRPKTKEEAFPYAEKIFLLFNSAYSGLFGIVPLTQRQIQFNIKKYLSFINPEFVSLVLDKNNELVAFGIAIPSLSKALQKSKGKLFPLGFLYLMRALRKNTVVDLLLIAIRKDLQGKGVNALVMRDITDAAIQRGIQYAESNPELEENSKVQTLWDYYESTQHKSRSCFIKYL